MKFPISRPSFARNLFWVLLLFLLPSAGFAEVRTSNIWWMPEPVTQWAKQIDVIFYVITWLTAGVFVLTQVFFIWFIIRYRQQEGASSYYTHGNNRLEVVWTLIPFVIFLALAFWGNDLWSRMKRKEPPADAIQIDIVAYQFGWNFRYAGKDGKLGASDPKLMDGGNPFGLIKDDPAGKDDVITSNEMVIPVNRPVRLHLRSLDVIHAFYVPEFRLFQDIVPGKTISWVWFQVLRTGNYEVACSQLCGAGHYKMMAKLNVVTEEQYEKWLTDHAPTPSPVAALDPSPVNLSSIH